MASKNKLLWLGGSAAALGGLAWVYNRKTAEQKYRAKFVEVKNQYSDSMTSYNSKPVMWSILPGIMREEMLAQNGRPPVGPKKERSDILLPTIYGWEASSVASFWYDTVLDLYKRSGGEIVEGAASGGDTRYFRDATKFKTEIARVAKTENCCPTAFYCGLVACTSTLSLQASQDFWYAVDKLAINVSTYTSFTPDSYWTHAVEAAKLAGKDTAATLSEWTAGAGQVLGKLIGGAGKIAGEAAANTVWGFVSAGATGIIAVGVAWYGWTKYRAYKKLGS